MTVLAAGRIGSSLQVAPGQDQGQGVRDEHLTSLDRRQQRRADARAVRDKEVLLRLQRHGTSSQLNYMKCSIVKVP